MKKIFVLSLAVLLATSTPVFAETEMSLKKILSHTYRTNPAIQSSYHQLESVHQNLDFAYASYRPTVTADANITYNNTDSDPGTSDHYLTRGAAVNLSQPLYRGGRTENKIQTARYIIMAQYESHIETVQNYFLQTTTSYYDLTKAKRIIALNEKNIKRITKQLEATKQRYEVGELSKTDVKQSEARLAQAKATLASANAQYQAAAASFQSLTALDPYSMSINLEPLPMQFNMEREHLTVTAMQNSPLVLASHYAYIASTLDIDQKYAELLPTINLVGSLSKTYDATSVVDSSTGAALGVQLSIPLYQAGNIRTSANQLKQIAAQRKQDANQAKRVTTQSIVSQYYNYQAAISTIQSRQEQVDANKLALEGVYAEMEVGSRTILDTLDAEQELLDSETALITAQRDKLVSALTLASIAGYLQPTSLKLDTNSSPLITAIQSDIKNQP